MSHHNGLTGTCGLLMVIFTTGYHLKTGLVRSISRHPQALLQRYVSQNRSQWKRKKCHPPTSPAPHQMRVSCLPHHLTLISLSRSYQKVGRHVTNSIGGDTGGLTFLVGYPSYTSSGQDCLAHQRCFAYSSTHCVTNFSYYLTYV